LPALPSNADKTQQLRVLLLQVQGNAADLVAFVPDAPIPSARAPLPTAVKAGVLVLHCVWLT
jgi:hypothetical protein